MLFLLTACCAFLTSLLVLLIVQVSEGLMFQYYYYTAYLVPYALIVFGGAFRYIFTRYSFSPVLCTGIGAIVAAVLVLPYAIQSLRYTSGCTNVCNFDNLQGVLVGVTALVLVAAILLRRMPLLLVAIIGMSVVNISAMGSANINRVVADSQYERYKLIQAANQELTGYGDVRLWFDASEPLGLDYVAVSAMHLWAYRLIGTQFPALQETTQYNSLGKIAPGTNIAVLSQKEDIAGKIDEALAPNSLKAKLLDQKQFTNGPFSFSLVVFTALPVGESIDLDSYIGPSSGSYSYGEGGVVTVTTPAVAFGTGAVMTLPPFFIDAYGPVPSFIHLSISLKDGDMGVGILSRDGSRVLDERRILAAKGPVDVLLNVPDLTNAGDIVLRSWVGGNPVRAQVLAMKASIPAGLAKKTFSETKIDLSGTQAAPTGKVLRTGDDISVTTSKNPGYFASVLPLDGLLAADAGSGVVRIRLEPEQGSFSLAILGKTGSVVAYKAASANGAKPIEIYLRVPDLANAASLIVLNGASPIESKVKLINASLIREVPPTDRP